MSDATLVDPGIVLPPTQAELPCDDSVPMETQRHKLQLQLLTDPLTPWLDQRPDGYVGGNMFVYFSLAQIRNQDFKGPDFFAVLGVPKGERRSWVVWEEGKAPDVVIELLSDSTANQDKNEKKLVYQNRMRVPEYFWFDPFNPQDWAGFALEHGAYQAIAVNAQNQLVSQQLELALTQWTGTYQGVSAVWLRWTTLTGELLLTSQEMAEQEQQRANQEQQRANQAEAQLQQVVRNLLQTGMSIEEVARVTSLTEAQIQAI
ncbi:MAG: Uma2 family endonuclease [Leptolyngbyaceae cyanobacterium RU_5_1]|nr:Uma2 family endonuclease [Leptolyngbyaceae cyanobacterium RU_5_1]